MEFDITLNYGICNILLLIKGKQKLALTDFKYGFLYRFIMIEVSLLI